ncbi:MAG: glucose 1-dehydrogenase [Chloroflexi bacterium]|nr:glucose 1-dehydrogenase [Chloroflexota bacterium]
MLLEGKVAVVTGASSGLGRETAKLFAAEGAKVVVADVNDEAGEQVADEIRAGGGEAMYVHTDVRRTAEVDNAVDVAERTHGRLDVMVANAGIMGRGSFIPGESVTDEEWAEVMDVNLHGVFRCFRAAIPALRRAGGGAMCATSSTTSVYGALYQAVYSATKGGINALVRALAVELAPEKIRVNAICPGAMPTNIGQSFARSAEEMAKLMEPRSNLPEKPRMERQLQDTLDMAKVHLFFCSDLAAHITGECMVVDHGYSMWNGL